MRVAPWRSRSPVQLGGGLGGWLRQRRRWRSESRLSLAVRTPPAVSSAGVRALATRSQLSRVLAGRPGEPSSKLAVSGWRTSGRSPVRARSLSPEAAAGGQLQRMSWKEWKRSVAVAWQLGVDVERVLRGRSRRGGGR